MQDDSYFFGGFLSPVSLGDALIAIGFSLLASIIAYLIYQYFYGLQNIGAGVHRMFIIGGPRHHHTVPRHTDLNPAFLLLPSFENGVPLLHESFGSFPRVFCRTQIAQGQRFPS